MPKRLPAMSAVVLALGCGGPDGSPPHEPDDARRDTKNACGGERTLVFLERPALPADPCGACAAGALVCAAPEILVCIGSTDASCADGGATNLCGGRGLLTLDGVPAIPGRPCGPCRDGMTICAAPEVVACISARSGATCREGGIDVIVDTTFDSLPDTASPDAAVDSSPDTASPDAAVDSPPDTASHDAATDSSLDTASSDASDAGSTPINPCGGQGPLRHQGVDALPGDRCGTCREGTLVCASPTTLACGGQSTSDVCRNDVAAPNSCGGMGPLTWRGIPTAPSARCGACSSSLRCASSNEMVCNGPLSCPDAGPDESCDIPTSAYTASSPALPALPPETAPTVTSATTVSLAANWLVYNPFDFRLYASVGSLQGTGGNSIAVIDPYGGTVVKSIFVGSEPRKMALSDDGQSLWVALDGAGTVRQVDLVAGTAGQQFSMGWDGIFGAWLADSVAVLPGTHSSVVVTRYSKTSTATESPIIYDDGVPRAFATGGFTYTATLVIPSYSPHLVFGYDNKSTGFELSTVCVSGNGLFMKQSIQPFGGFGMSFSFAENVLYSSTGIAYDIATGNTLGTFAGRGPLAADAPKRRVYFLSTATAPTVSAYDMDTFLHAGSETVPTAIPNSATLDNLVRWGRYGYAFRANSQSVVIARSALVGATP